MTTTESVLDSARRAVEERRWSDAFDLYAQADEIEALDGAALEDWAWTALWSGRYDRTIPLLERAEEAYAGAGDREGEARALAELARQHGIRSDMAVATGYAMRVARLLEGQPECSAHAMLEYLLGLVSHQTDRDEAREHFERSLEIARHTGDRDLEAIVLLQLAHVAINEGELDQGTRMVDEAMAMAASGSLGPMAGGNVYCQTIWACRNTGDIRRAREWSQVADRWCERQSIAVFPGVCRVHRAELIRLGGALEEAERDAEEGARQLDEFTHMSRGWAYQELGEVRLRRGDLDGAEESFMRAVEVGHDPQPGLARLQLIRGNESAACRALAPVLTRRQTEQVSEWPYVLPVLVTAAIAAGELDTAREASAALDERATALRTPAVAAAAAGARGELALAEGRPDEACGLLHDAWRGWCGVGAPYEAAQVRMHLAEAAAEAGDATEARLSLEAAAQSFERLGAVLDAEGARHRLADLDAPAARAQGIRTTRTFVFSDIVDSTKLVELLGDDAWGSLLRWHDRTLRRLLDEHDGEEVKHEGDGFFVSFSSPDAALGWATEVQRTLAEHRDEHGFAPRVRIGVHAGEATEVDGDYSGRAIHTAARIATAATADEVVASVATVAEAGRAVPDEVRDLELKGLAEPVAVATVGW